MGRFRALLVAETVDPAAGTDDLVTDRTGFRATVDGRDALLAGVRKVFEDLVADPAVVRPTGQRARQRVLDHYTWAAKARQTLAVYRWVVGREPRPDLGLPFPDRPTTRPGS